MGRRQPLTATLISATAADSGSTTSTEPDVPESRTVHVDDFIPGQILEFQVPAAWETGRHEQIVSAASFSPPHVGIAGSLPEGLLIEILPHTLPIPEEETQPAGVEGWTRGAINRADLSTVVFMNASEGVSLLANNTAEAPLSEDDMELLMTIVETVKLEEG